MSQATSSPRLSVPDALAVAARWILGAVYVYMGLSKALHPVDFLKILREYQMIDNHVLLNLIAASLPWFEVLCGSLLLAGVAVRGSSLLSLGMLIPFTLIVLNRALAIHHAKAIAFCAIRFDCGCGAGEVVICHKLLENGLLLLLSVLLVCVRNNRGCLRYELVKIRQSQFDPE
jgi:uncharacterized membrane protein YphA (DoxX/SURF4 family)